MNETSGETGKNFDTRKGAAIERAPNRKGPDTGMHGPIVTIGCFRIHAGIKAGGPQ
jgi:hypothetical protein